MANSGRNGIAALASDQAPRVLTTADLRWLKRAENGAAPAPASLARMTARLLADGLLLPVARGLYLNRLAGPDVDAAEAAQHLRRGAIPSLAWVLEKSGALNNYGDTITCVVPHARGMAPPKVGRRATPIAAFRFFAMPQRVVAAGADRVEDVQDLRYAYPRATPERALLDWIYLGASPHSRLALPPGDIRLGGMDRRRLGRVARAMGVEAAWRAWLARHADA